jgi:hypothetical protein
VNPHYPEVAERAGHRCEYCHAPGSNLPKKNAKFLQDGKAVRVRENGQEYVLLRPDVYERLSEGEYDDGSMRAAR